MYDVQTDPFRPQNKLYNRKFGGKVIIGCLIIEKRFENSEWKPSKYAFFV